MPRNPAHPKIYTYTDGGTATGLHTEGYLFHYRWPLPGGDSEWGFGVSSRRYYGDPLPSEQITMIIRDRADGSLTENDALHEPLPAGWDVFGYVTPDPR